MKVATIAYMSEKTLQSATHKADEETGGTSTNVLVRHSAKRAERRRRGLPDASGDLGGEHADEEPESRSNRPNLNW
jgi:hypothetical protein